MKNYDINRLSNQGFPFCPKCGGILYWDGSNTMEELNKAEAGSPEADDTVFNLHCADCGRHFEMTDDDNGYKFIDTSRY